MPIGDAGACGALHLTKGAPPTDTVQGARRMAPVVRDEAGQGLTEYVLILSGVCLAALVAVSLLGLRLDAAFGHVAACFQRGFVGC